MGGWGVCVHYASGLEAVFHWQALEVQRHAQALPVPWGPYGGSTEVKMRVWLAERQKESGRVAVSFCP